jgi:large subunit ribosomal protein L25
MSLLTTALRSAGLGGVGGIAGRQSRISLAPLISARGVFGGGHADPDDPSKWIEPEYVPTEFEAPALDNDGGKREYKLTCNTRLDSEDGQRMGRRFRSEGVVPGVIYGNAKDGTGLGRAHPSNKRVMVTTPHKDIQRELRKNKNDWGVNAFESRVYELTVADDFPEADLKAGDVIPVVPRHLQMHPVDNQVMSVNFLRYWPGRVLSLPLVPVNTELSTALKRGAFILKQNRFVEVTVAEGYDIPEHIELDCTDARLKDTLRRNRLILPEGCEWGKKVKEDFLVGSVYGRAKLVADEAPTDAPKKKDAKK